MLQQYLSALLTGAGIGSMYGLTALGFYITYTISRTVNFAQGASLMMGAVIAFSLVQTHHWSIWLAIPVTLLCCGLWGAFVERVAVAPFVARGSESWLMATVALGLILENVVLFTFGKDSRGMASSLLQINVVLFDVRVNALQLLIPVAGFSIALLLGLFIKSTTRGKSLAAIALNPSAARLMGIHTEKYIAFAFSLSGVLAGIAGMLIAPLYTVSAGMGTIFGIKAFAAAILGGIDSAWGVMAGGLVLGVIEALLVTTFGSTYAQMFSFGLTILVLTIKPAGLFGRTAVKKI